MGSIQKKRSIGSKAGKLQFEYVPSLGDSYPEKKQNAKVSFFILYINMANIEAAKRTMKVVQLSDIAAGEPAVSPEAV